MNYETSLRTIVSLLLLGCSCGPQPSADAGPDSSVLLDAAGDGSVRICEQSSDCDNGRFCDGEETCDPGGAGAGSDGCVPGTPPCAAAACDEDSASCSCGVVADMDGDGSESIACGGDDCDDEDGNRFPGNSEVCDSEGHDEDCVDTTFGGIDLDGDGFESALCCNGPSCGPDCDDLRREVHPGATEQCNAIDDDCDGSVDESGAFCPVGVCIDRRCRAPNWEWVYGSDRLDLPFGLEVDSSGNVYVGVFLAGAGGDLDGDGTSEPPGPYLVSVAPEGFPRWFVPAPGARSYGALALDADESAVIVPTPDELRFYSTSDGATTGSLSVAPFGRWEAVSIVDAARVGVELVVAATAVITDEVPDPWDPDMTITEVVESAIVLVRYDRARTEIGRRVIELAGERLSVSDVAGSQNHFAMLGRSSAPVDLGAGEIDGGFLAVLQPDLTTHWANAAGSAMFRIAVSDEGRAAAVGTFSGFPWTPPWTTTSYTSMGSNDAFAVSFDSDGSHLWTRVHSGPEYDFFLGVDYDGRDNLFVSGYFTGEMMVPPLGTLGPAVGMPPCDAFFGLFGVVDGFARDARQIEGTQCETVHHVRVDPFGGMLVLGDFGETVTLPSGTPYSTVGSGWRNLFLIRISDL